MSARRLRLLLLAALAVSACGGDPPPTAPQPAPATFARIDIPRPEGVFEQVIDRPGDVLQLRAVASFSDGSRTDVTADAAWTVVDPRVLSVSRGLVTGLSDGGTTVQAAYRGQANITNVRVGIPPSQRRYPISGVVRDADVGTPVPGAELHMGAGEGERVVAVTDGGGFFNLGDVAGRVQFTVSRLGYVDTPMTIGSASDAPSSLVVSLAPTPGRYIERTLAGALGPPPPGFQESRTSVHLTTRAGGVFDAIVQPASCAGSSGLRLLAESGEKEFVGGWASGCTARLRFVVPTPDVELTIVGFQPTDWVLTFREPL